ncbi:MAG: hypothetical protein A4S09_10070 [Proteobacteria bacterium SG_bin7]|nr:MAG: hypothetical protein A4S09_10070 [Proteobacteria bacterium SG_bin7]
MFNDNFFNELNISSPTIEHHLSLSLLNPLREFLDRPKKQIRSQLVSVGFAISRSEHPETDVIKQISEILESIHSASLIVDDVQDESLERRGQPSFHRLHGTATAINSGNWLYFLAIKRLRELAIASRQKNAIIHKTLDTLFEGHIGQALDIGVPIVKVPRSEIPEICYSTMNSKTGALTGLAIYCGAVTGGIDDSRAEYVFNVGREFGILLQMIDDIKNIKLNANRAQNSKRFEDLKNLRPGFIWAFTAEYLDASALLALKSSVESLPDTKAFADWSEKYDFFEKVLGHIQMRKLRFLKKCPDLTEYFTPIISQLEEAYETT